jgi:hypothetical protein
MNLSKPLALLSIVRAWGEITGIMIEPVARLVSEPIVKGGEARDGFPGKIHFEKKQGLPCLFFVMQSVMFFLVGGTGLAAGITFGFAGRVALCRRYLCARLCCSRRSTVGRNAGKSDLGRGGHRECDYDGGGLHSYLSPLSCFLWPAQIKCGRIVRQPGKFIYPNRSDH